MVYKFLIMFEEEKFPQSFKNTTLHMIFKGGKGKKETLSNSRFIHSKSWFPRTAEACLVEEGLKGPLVECSSIYQIGGAAGPSCRRASFCIQICYFKVQGTRTASDYSKLRHS